MTKDGKRFICHTESGKDVASWTNAKPAPKEWYETVSEENRVLCWVSDDDPNSKEFAEWIRGYNKDSEFSFKSYGNNYRKYATPVTCDDLSRNQ
jgi:hypothetical protein